MKTSSWYVVKQRLAWIKMHERGTPVTGVCDHYGISRKTFYKWYGRYQESDRDFHVLNGRSRRPHTHPRSVPNRVGERVVAMRHKTRYGHQAHSLLPGPGRHHHQRLWLSTVSCREPAWYASDAQGLARSLRATPWLFPGQRVQIDVKYLPLLHLKGRPEPLRQYLYNAIDDCTRLQIAHVSSELTPQTSVRFLHMVRRSFPFPFPVHEVQTDHGSEFTFVFFPHVQKPPPLNRPWATWAYATS